MTMQLPFFSSVGTPGTPEQIKQCQDSLPGNSKRTNKVSIFPHYNDYQKLIIQLKKSEASPNKEWLSCTIPASFRSKESNNDQAIRFVAKSQRKLDFLLMSTNNLKKSRNHILSTLHLHFFNYLYLGTTEWFQILSQHINLTKYCSQEHSYVHQV